MELLDEEILNSREFIFLRDFFNSSSKPSYLTFKSHINIFIKKVMRNYIKNTPFCNDSCSCFCYEKLESLGSFASELNIILINEKVVKKIYDEKDLSSLAVLFHELNHFKIKYDIKLGVFDEYLLRVIKEELISKSSTCPSFIKIYEADKNTYYDDNYDCYSEEKLADLYALDNLLIFMKNVNISINESQKKRINELIKLTVSKFNNYFRDVSNNLNFNSYFIDFEEAFDILIKDNPSWLEYPQLLVEYYIDEEGNVIKRNKEQLNELLDKETNMAVQEYIRKILNNEIVKDNYSKNKKSLFNKKIIFNDLNKSNKLQ